jgi:formylglycine-generating enzyme required for sulfatase activity
MSAILKISEIDEAVANLHYRNTETLKYKLVHSILNYYKNESSLDSLQKIGTDELVKALWDTGDDPVILKSKRKNFSSVKSGINTDLKKLYKEGNNPQGVIIGQNNLFDMSDEAKDKALGTIADVLKEQKADSIAKIDEVLKVVNDIISESSSLLNLQSDSEAIKSMKSLISDLSHKIGFSLPGDSGPKDAGVSKSAMSGGSVDEMGASNVADSLRGAVINEAGAVGPDMPKTIAKRTLGQKLLDEISEISEDEVKDEIIDQIETEGAGEAINKIAEEGSIEKTGKYTEGAARIEGLSGHGEAKGGVVAKIQDYRQESETIDEAGPVEMLEEADTIDEIAKAISDEVLEEEPVAEEEWEEIEADAEIAEIEVEAALPAEVISDEVLEEEPVAEEELEEIEADAEIAEIEVEEALQEKGPCVENIVEENLREKAEILTKLAEAAKILVKLGPELDDTIFNEKEIKEKAKFLSEEFERELSIREKYFNQHIFIKGGEYIIGGGNTGKYELHNQTVSIPEFYIGKFPVTNCLFEIFVDRSGYRTTAEKRGYGFVYTPRTQRTKDSATGLETFLWSSNLQYKKVQGACWYRPNGPGSSLYNKRRHPVVQVSLEDARAFAAWTGKRVPTEKEWEAATRTSRGYIYPWGNQWKDNACNIEKSYFGDTTPVDKYLKFVNGAGVVDTLGNVLEWTLELWRSSPSGEKNTDMCVVKGGSWISDSSISLSRQFPMDKNTTSNILGFRCVAI